MSPSLPTLHDTSDGHRQLLDLVHTIERSAADAGHYVQSLLLDSRCRGVNVDTPAAKAKTLLAMRRKRDQLLGNGLFGEPAWDMLLDLFIANEAGRRISISSLCIASACASTTALRYIAQMIYQGLVERYPDGQDGRRMFVQLTGQGNRFMRKLLETA